MMANFPRFLPGTYIAHSILGITVWVYFEANMP